MKLAIFWLNVTSGFGLRDWQSVRVCCIWIMYGNMWVLLRDTATGGSTFLRGQWTQRRHIQQCLLCTCVIICGQNLMVFLERLCIQVQNISKQSRRVNIAWHMKSVCFITATIKWNSRKIKSRLNSGNFCYMQFRIPSSRFLSKIVKIKI